MKIIYRIAKTELQMLFYSPIAWLLLLCFVVQTSIIFTGICHRFVMEMDTYGISRMASVSLFARFREVGLWPQVQSFLYFYIPLLTMGMVSRDLSSGSIKLLYSSPISSTQIILGKYLCMVFYVLILMVVLAGGVKVMMLKQLILKRGGYCPDFWGSSCWLARTWQWGFLCPA